MARRSKKKAQPPTNPTQPTNQSNSLELVTASPRIELSPIHRQIQLEWQKHQEEHYRNISSYHEAVRAFQASKDKFLPYYDDPSIFNNWCQIHNKWSSHTIDIVQNFTLWLAALSQPGLSYEYYKTPLSSALEFVYQLKKDLYAWLDDSDPDQPPNISGDNPFFHHTMEMLSKTRSIFSHIVPNLMIQSFSCALNDWIIAPSPEDQRWAESILDKIFRHLVEPFGNLYIPTSMPALDHLAINIHPIQIRMSDTTIYSFLELYSMLLTHCITLQTINKEGLPSIRDRDDTDQSCVGSNQRFNLYLSVGGIILKPELIFWQTVINTITLKDAYIKGSNQQGSKLFHDYDNYLYQLEFLIPQIPTSGSSSLYHLHRAMHESNRMFVFTMSHRDDFQDYKGESRRKELKRITESVLNIGHDFYSHFQCVSQRTLNKLDKNISPLHSHDPYLKDEHLIMLSQFYQFYLKDQINLLTCAAVGNAFFLIDYAGKLSQFLAENPHTPLETRIIFQKRASDLYIEAKHIADHAIALGLKHIPTVQIEAFADRAPVVARQHIKTSQEFSEYFATLFTQSLTTLRQLTSEKSEQINQAIRQQELLEIRRIQQEEYDRNFDSLLQQFSEDRKPKRKQHHNVSRKRIDTYLQKQNGNRPVVTATDSSPEHETQAISPINTRIQQAQQSINDLWINKNYTSRPICAALQYC